MAEAIARSLVGDSRMSFSSAGSSAVEGLPASGPALAEMTRRGLSLDSHRSRGLSEELLAEADLVLAMEDVHRRRLRRFSASEGKVMLLSEWAGETDSGLGVDDPFGGSEDDYERTADRLAALLSAGLGRR